MQITQGLPARMRAMRLDVPGQPLRLARVPLPQPGPGQVLLRVTACGVCRTDLHIADGDLAPHRQPVIPGHEITGTVVACGPGVSLETGSRLGVPWLGATCGHCPWCATGRENLCDAPTFTGYDQDGGYAEFAVANAQYCLPLPKELDDIHLAPMLCAGLIGYRAWKMAGPVRRLGLYGFGAAAHLLTQLALAEGQEVHAITRAEDLRSQAFARELGAVWAGPPEAVPVVLDAAILFAPAGELVPMALKSVSKGGTVVCAGIHMTDIPSFPYSSLWGERVLRSVANLTRADGRDFLQMLQKVKIDSRPTIFPLERANEALDALRGGRIDGAAVLVP